LKSEKQFLVQRNRNQYRQHILAVYSNLLQQLKYGADLSNEALNSERKTCDVDLNIFLNTFNKLGESYIEENISGYKKKNTYEMIKLIEVKEKLKSKLCIIEDENQIALLRNTHADKCLKKHGVTYEVLSMLILKYTSESLIAKSAKLLSSLELEISKIDTDIDELQYKLLRLKTESAEHDSSEKSFDPRDRKENNIRSEIDSPIVDKEEMCRKELNSLALQQKTLLIGLQNIREENELKW
jgi:hypothetical protein